VAIRGDHVGEFTAGTAGAFGAIPFEKIVLINVAVLRGVALDAANGIGARHGRIIEAMRNEVNAGVWREDGSQNETGF
jgi:hypothetical protein